MKNEAATHYRVSHMRLLPSMAAALAAFALLTGCGSDSDTSPSDTSARATATTDTQAEALQPPAGVDFDVPDESGNSVFASFNVSENDVAEGTARRGAQEETVAILEYARGAYPGASKIFVMGWLPPAEGSDEDRQVLDAEYERATLEKINFAQIDPSQIWDMRDGGTVHPELQ